MQSDPSAVPAGESLSPPVPKQARRTLEGRARRLPTRERTAYHLLMTTGAIWPGSGVDRSTVRRLEAKGLAQLVSLDRTCWLGELPDGLYATATVHVPAPRPPVPPAPDQLEEMQRAVRSRALFEARRHNRDRGYDYTPVCDAAGAVVGWRYRIGLDEHGWVTVDGQLDSRCVATEAEAEAALRAANESGAVPGAVLQAVRSVHPTAHVFRPVTGEGQDPRELLGWVFQCLTPRGGYGWGTVDGTVWRAAFDSEGPAQQSLRRQYALTRTAAQAQRIVREDMELPELPADRAQAVVDAAHGETTELLPFEPGGRRLGYTCRTGTGYGWITAYGSHARFVEATRLDAEGLIALALVQDRVDGRTGTEQPRPLLVDSGTLNFGEARAGVRTQHRRACLFEATYGHEGDLLGWTFAVPGRGCSRSDSRYGWVSTGGLRGELVDTRSESQAALARAWIAHRPADSAPDGQD